jgi:hypothetical protein
MTAIATVLVSAAASAQDAPTRDQIAAANSRALEGLRVQVVSEPIGPGLTVADLLSRTGTGKKLNETLARAQQIGGPRWLDDHTVQVRLEIGGPTVKKALVDLATLKRLESPVEPNVLEGRLKDWDRRTFSAIGTSTAGGAFELVRPVAHARAWDAVADDARKAALAQARQNAVAQILKTIGPTPLAGDRKVSDALGDKDITRDLEQWLAQRPVTQVEFRDDLQVRTTLAVPGAELFDVFRKSAAKHPDAVGPVDEAGWYKVRDEFVARLAQAATCRGAAHAGGGRPRPAAVQLPRNPPDWADQTLDADGAGNARDSALKAARAAEAEATDKLRAQIASLSLSQGLTMGDAAKQDKQIAEAIDRALGHARRTKVEYGADGGARVVVSLELVDLWQELQDRP